MINFPSFIVAMLTVFDMGRRGKKKEAVSERTIAALEAKLAQKNEVIAELMQETLKLKKANGEI